VRFVEVTSKAEAEDVLAEVLSSDVTAVEEVTRLESERSDLQVRFRDGTSLLIEVKAAAHPSPDQITRLAASLRPPGANTNERVLLVLVADVLSEAARRTLAEAGWGFFDRRGYLYLHDEPRLLEVSVPGRPRQAIGRSRPGIRGASGIVVAYAHLLEPRSVLGVRGLTRASRLLSPTSISNARRALEEANLLESDGRPVLPDLFWALAGHWSRPLTGLARVVTTKTLERLGHNTNGPYFRTLEELAQMTATPEAFEGVAVGGDLAAELYGAPIVRTPASPFDLYIPGEVLISRLKRECGEARHVTDRAVGIRPFPISLAARTRLRARPGSHGLSLAHPLAVALDLAQDPARGREVLENFEPAECERVW
jgi:hypothetical protein